MVRRFSLGYTLFIRFSDVVLVIITLALSYRLRTGIPLGIPAAAEALDTPPALYLIAAVVWQIAFQVAGVYSPAQSAWLLREIQRIMLGTGFACLLFFGALYITYRDYSRLQAVYFVILMLFVVIIHRIGVRGFYKIVGGRSTDSRVVAIIGTDTFAQHIGEMVSFYAWGGLYLLGFVKHKRGDPVVEGLESKVLGAAEDLTTIVEQGHVNEVIVALQTPDRDYLNHIIEQLQNYTVNIWLAPDFSDLAYFQVSVENFGGVPLIGLREAVLSPSQRVLKRLSDMIISGMALFFGWPLMLLIAIAIRLDSPGPAIFTQERIGEHGRHFKMYKFRSMYIDAEARLNKASVDYKRRDDPRVTRVGRLIRRTSMDELPQFLNIFKGDMSIVGPRPEMPWLVEKYEPWQRKRFEVPQGLTGWWQINGRADKPMILHTEDDLFYIRNYSLWMDFQIMVRTAVAIIRGRGAY